MRALYYALLFGLALGGCRATRPPETTEPLSDYSRAEGTPYAPFTPRVPDSPSITPSKTTKGDESKSALVKPKAGFLGLFGRKETKEAVHNSPYLPSKKCKGCTFNVVAGNQSNNTAGKNAAAGDGATNAAKATGPTATGSSTATNNTKAGQRGGAAATAPNATATATTQKGGIPWWLWLIGAGLVGYGAVRVYKRFTPV